MLEKSAATAGCKTLNQLFDENPRRFESLSFAHAGLLVDFSRTHLSAAVLADFDRFAIASGLPEWRRKLLQGDIVNPTEQRPALHFCLRAGQPLDHTPGGEPVASRLREERDCLYGFATAVRSGARRTAAGKPFRDLIHLGIGGSALGPRLLLDALGFGVDHPYRIHCVANVDGHALAPVMAACNPQETLLIVTSKTFTTSETLANLHTLMQWLEGSGVTNPLAQIVAVTAAPQRAAELGLDESQILTFPDWVGGRYSIWSAVSLVALIALGTEFFDELRRGAAAMDDHFAEAPPVRNLPMLAGLTDLWYGNCWGAATRALFVYDGRLATLVPWLQQLEMENNGKQCTREGKRVHWQTSPILWGGVGTEAQHAVFQLLHQGTHLTPVEFVAVLEPGHALAHHHQSLLANCFAQGAALMRGRNQAETSSQADGAAADYRRLAAAAACSGNRPSTTIVLDRLDPGSLGALLAFYEHRSFVAGTLWGINVFDQMGVELGKQLAHACQAAIDRGDAGDLEVDASTRELLRRVQGQDGNPAAG